MDYINARKPWEVNQSKFQVKREDVLYADELYALAISNYDGSPHKALGIRWQVDTNSHGFPNIGTTPLWMVVPDELAIPMLAHILANKETGENEFDHQRICDAIKDIRDTMDNKK